MGFLEHDIASRIALHDQQRHPADPRHLDRHHIAGQDPSNPSRLAW